ncbi:TAXI family TRAP transporter solute-binding subunit [Paenisporosarcina sp. TG-14]|uniref:TAXI family TRAP transporter solute-binding subunit n=1 Tax=Paenisporosarcina sp. TG-14 TaxID=1231057 RepID=UPI00031D160D|nr:TAXI family TRAP transporter solute-binding subunit [Paenisporosarcina sp. TG-14]
MKTKLVKGLATVLLASVVLAACGADEGEKTSEGNGSEGLDSNLVTIATGGASGPYNIIGTALGELYSSELGVNSKTQTTGASVENINLIKQEKIEMAFVMSDVLSEAVDGEGNFDEKVENVSQIASLYPNYVQIVTTKKTGINSFGDLKGKRIAVGAQNSGVEVNARNLLEGHGITYDDVEVDYLGYAEAADALKSGKIDAAFLTSGIPNASLMELEQGLDMMLVPVDPEKIKEIAQDQTYFVALDIPAGTYGNEEAIPTAAIMNALVVRSDMSDDDVYKLTKSFFEGLEDLTNAHQAASDISLEAAQEGMVAPVHPGAQRYYDEQ